MDYRFLTSDDLLQLHEAYLAAFSNYAIKIEPSRDQLLRVLVRNGLRWDISSGVFTDNCMVGFTANGFDYWDEQPTAYDSGTGVIPAHRRCGIALKLFELMLPRLSEQGIRQYLLEVITSNEPALNLYRRLGFAETRTLELLALDQPLRTSNREQHRDGLTILEIAVPDWNWKLLQSFWSYQPSWANSITAIERSVSSKLMLGAYLDEECVGYGIVSPASGDIPQLAVAPTHRRQGIGSALLRALHSRVTPGKTVTMTNIDSSSHETLAFSHTHGFHRVITQLEMMLKL
jgi:ribosomal protein S18 acetylase RimI-like enzyme